MTGVNHLIVFKTNRIPFSCCFSPHRHPFFILPLPRSTISPMSHLAIDCRRYPSAIIPQSSQNLAEKKNCWRSAVSNRGILISLFGLIWRIRPLGHWDPLKLKLLFKLFLVLFGLKLVLFFKAFLLYQGQERKLQQLGDSLKSSDYYWPVAHGLWHVAHPV